MDFEDLFISNFNKNNLINMIYKFLMIKLILIILLIKLTFFLFKEINLQRYMVQIKMLIAKNEYFINNNYYNLIMFYKNFYLEIF